MAVTLLHLSLVTTTLLLLPISNLVLAAGTSGSGKTTRYWDCCKPSCAWSKPGISTPVTTCDKNDQPISDASATSGCEGGTSFMCSSQVPWAVSDDLAYGFGAVSAQSVQCCQCYKLKFTSGQAQGKTFIMQATNTGTDVAEAAFDLAMPGGGFGMFDACTNQWEAKAAVWGKTYGGMSDNLCAKMPSKLQPGCEFRWGWMGGADNPTVDYEVVDCPAEIVEKSGCSVEGWKKPDSATTTTPTISGNNATQGESGPGIGGESNVGGSGTASTSISAAPPDITSASSPSDASGVTTFGDAGIDTTGLNSPGPDTTGSSSNDTNITGPDITAGSDATIEGEGQGEDDGDECEAEL